MPPFLFLSLAATAAPDIVVTAALDPVVLSQAPAAVTVFDAGRIEALGAPFAVDLLRLAPGVSVTGAGGPGQQAQVRIRGGEANHTLLFVDGIAFDDVASDDQARFETLPADGLGRIEVIRGPQSALWGSEALGGVIALATPDPSGPLRLTATGEFGGLDTRRAAAAVSAGGEHGGVSATGSWLKSDGIDVLGGGRGDRDGVENYTASLKAVARPGEDGEFGIVGRYVHHDVSYDGTDASFQRADTADASTAETKAVRGWARIGRAPDAPWSVQLDAQYLDSDNRNRTGTTPVNSSNGQRSRIGGTATRRLALGATAHVVEARIEREDESFATRDLQGGGAGDQRLTRGRTAFVGEWRAAWGTRLSTDVALRHDAFDRSRDATTLRAHAIVPVVAGLALVGGYGEGIAQPGFGELFGFAANTGFVGNPALTPEKSRGYEGGLRLTGARVSAELVAFSNRLRDEIVYAGLPSFQYTYVNAAGASRRRGIEASATVRPAAGLRVDASYTFLDAREPRTSGDPPAAQEVRRPRHSASLSGEWRTGRLTLGGALDYVGRRRDIDFDSYTPVWLDDYVLAGGRVALVVTPAVEAFARLDNAFDARYQDVVGYATPGRTFHAGLRLRLEP